MTVFKIEIQEILARTITVEATSETDALEKVETLYKSEQIVLDADDFVDVSLKVER